MRSIDWELSREKMWTDQGTIPPALTHTIRDVEKSQNDPIELSSDDDDDDDDDEEDGDDDEDEEENDDDQSTPLQPAERAGESTTESRPGNTDIEGPSASTGHSEDSKASNNQHNQDDTLLFNANAVDLSKADDGALYRLLTQARQQDEDDQDNAAAKSIQTHDVVVDLERVRSAQTICDEIYAKGSAGKAVNHLLQDLLDEDILAVQSASQVHYDGAANKRRGDSVADLVVEPINLTRRDGNDRVAGCPTSALGPVKNYQPPVMTKPSELGLARAKERGKVPVGANEKMVVHLENAGVQAKVAEGVAVGDFQATIPRDYEHKHDTSEQDKSEAPQRKKTAAFVERRRLLDLDNAEQLKKAEADRALKSLKDPEKTGKSLAAQVLRAQRERQRAAERRKAYIVGKDPPKAADKGENHDVLSQPAQTRITNGTSNKVIRTPASTPATTSASTSATAFTTAPATARITVPATTAAIIPTTAPTIFPTIGSAVAAASAPTPGPASSPSCASASASVSTFASASTSASASTPAPAPAPTSISVTASSIAHVTTHATPQATTSVHTVQKAPQAITSFTNTGQRFNQQSATIVGKCAADEPLNKNERVPPIPLQVAENILRSSLEGFQKRKPQTAMLSNEKHIEGTAPKKARINESTLQRIGDVRSLERPTSRYIGTTRSSSGTSSGAASRGTHRTRMTTAERKKAGRLSDMKYNRKKAEEPVTKAVESRGSTAVSSPLRMGFAALSRLSPSPSDGTTNFPEPGGKKGHTKAHEKPQTSRVRKDRRQEYPRIKERRRLEKKKEVQSSPGTVISSSTTTADASEDEVIYLDTMDSMEVDPEPEEETPRPTTGGKTITQEMLDILRQKPESLSSFVDESPYQETEEDATYYEYVVKRLSWKGDDDEDPEDIEPLLCTTGYLDVDAANSAAGDEILLERANSSVYPLDSFHWKKDPVTGMATYDASSAAGAVRVFVERILRPQGPGCRPSKRALRAARMINPVVYVVLVKNTIITTAAVPEVVDVDDLFEDEPPVKPVVEFTVEVCRTRELANKVASEKVLERLKGYQTAGVRGEIERAEREGVQRGYLRKLDEVDGLYGIEPELLGEGNSLEVWVEARVLKGPCN